MNFNPEYKLTYIHFNLIERNCDKFLFLHHVTNILIKMRFGQYKQHITLSSLTNEIAYHVIIWLSVPR
jgi:hypothetical protein